MSVPMALVDFIPVILFAVSAVIIQRGLYEPMSKGAFALMSGGTIMVVASGVLKATWKLLYGAGICDFERLNQAFFPMQAVGFLLAGIAVIAFLFFPQKKGTVAAVAAPPVFTGTMIFVAFLLLGSLGYCGGLGIYAARKKNTKAAILFWVAFAFTLGMGYLSSKDFSQASANWIAEGVNVVGQFVLLLAAKTLFKKD